MTASLQMIVGFLLLLFGGEALVKGSVALAKHMGISLLIIALTIVAIGTSAPELVVSINAALSNHPDIGVGNIIGSNIANILLVLGLSAAVATIPINPVIIKTGAPFLLIITILFVFLCFSGGKIEAYEGIILLLLQVAYVIYIIKSSKKKKNLALEKETKEDLPADTNNFMAIILVVLGIFALIYGADVFVEGSASIARLFGISEAAIALTLVAIGSSAPEIATCVVAAYRGHPDIVAGNVIGSNLVNIMVGMSVPAIIIDLPLNHTFLAYDVWVMLAATLCAIVIIITHKKVNRFTGVLFFIAYIVYISSQFLKI